MSEQSSVAAETSLSVISVTTEARSAVSSSASSTAVRTSSSVSPSGNTLACYLSHSCALSIVVMYDLLPQKVLHGQ